MAAFGVWGPGDRPVFDGQPAHDASGPAILLGRPRPSESISSISAQSSRGVSFPAAYGGLDLAMAGDRGLQPLGRVPDDRVRPCIAVKNASELRKILQEPPPFHFTPPVWQRTLRGIRS